MNCARRDVIVRVFLGLLLALFLTLATQPLQAQVVKRQEVIRASEQQLQKVLQNSGEEMRVTRVFYRHDLPLPDGKVSFSVDSHPEELKPGRQHVAVNVAVDGKVATVIKVSATLKQRVKYLTFRRHMKRGDVVVEADLQWTQADMERAMPDLVLDSKMVIGQATTRQIPADKPLKSSWFDAPVVVERGDRVQVAAVHGALHIQAVGVAQADGRVGETIAMENPVSRRRFDARILAPGRAQVTMW